MYISEKPKGRANKSKERAKRRVGRARSKKEGKRRAWEGAPQKEGSLAAMVMDIRCHGKSCLQWCTRNAYQDYGAL